MFGYDERPPAIQYVGTPLGRMGDATHQILSYVATPMAMPILCAVARFMCSACWGPAAWAGVIVDTRGVRPCGNKAHNLWRRWSSAKVVVSGVWAANSVGILASSKVTVWRWRQPVSIGGIPIVVSHSPVPPSITVFIDRMNGRAALCFTSTNDPRIIAEDVVGGKQPTT